MDLVGSIPSLGLIFPYRYLGLLRLARLNRVNRIYHHLGVQRRGELLQDILRNRSKYASFLIGLLAIIVLSSASVLVLQFESCCQAVHLSRPDGMPSGIRSLPSPLSVMEIITRSQSGGALQAYLS